MAGTARSPKVGRPTKLTDERMARVIAAVRAGNYAEPAAALAGVAKATLYNWIERGTQGEEPFKTFLDGFTQAEAEAEAEALAACKAAWGEDWRAAIEYLKRRYPRRWSPPQETQVTGGDGKALEIVIRRVTETDDAEG